MNPFYTRRRYAAILVCIFALLAGCSQSESNSDTASAGKSGIGTTSSASLSVEPALLSLSPGAAKQLSVSSVNKDQNKKPLTKNSGVTYATSAPNVVSVAGDGTVTASAQAKTGQTATVTVHYKSMAKEIAVIIKESLDDTIRTVGGVPTVTNESDIDVVVNKQRYLPATYEPNLVEPNVPFTFKEKNEKRLMRPEAAQALEQLFAAAKKDDITLYGISAYRSYKTQTFIFNNNVKTQGKNTAEQFSAKPGTSEHQTGLAIDVGDGDSKCAVEQCFADSPAAKWLVQHAGDYGFIIRYPKGKESITGYDYEPWHIRYVGIDVAKDIAKQGITLEEYFQDAVAAGTKSTPSAGAEKK